MITKVQGKTVSGELSVKACPRLNGLEKAMLKWAVVDPEDRVLDASVGRGLMAEYLRRNMQCEVCGVSSDMEDVRAARARLQSCDIVYAPVGDIPWRRMPLTRCSCSGGVTRIRWTACWARRFACSSPAASWCWARRAGPRR